MLSAVLITALLAVPITCRSELSQRRLQKRACSCSTLEPPEIEGFEVTDFSAVKTDKFGPIVCDVNIYLTHGDANDTVRVQTLLPLQGLYNGRFRAVGGGGLDAGWFDDRLAENIEDGYVVAATDAGLDPASDWLNQPDLVQQLLVNFVYLSIHEMTLVGKALAEQLYGEPPSYSYFTACSNGGRQGLAGAQRYPEDYDGVLAVAPVSDFPRFSAGSMWPYLVQVRENTFPEFCVWDAITDKAIDACAGPDRMISDPLNCDFDATSLVGETVCEDVTITETIAKLWKEVTAGPTNPDGSRAWFGYPAGTNLTNVASPGWFEYGSWLVRNFVEQIPDGEKFDENTIPADELYLRIERADRLFGQLFMTDNVDLTSFRDAGGKLLSWHGLADETVPPQLTHQYRERVLSNLDDDNEDESSSGTDFFRFFEAPGVRHCRGGQGAVPTRDLQQLVDWVENDNAPETLEASGVVGDRELCLWPGLLTYTGDGDLAEASSWTCE